MPKIRGDTKIVCGNVIHYIYSSNIYKTASICDPANKEIIAPEMEVIAERKLNATAFFTEKPE